MTPAPKSPLEARDERRGRVVKRKVQDRITDVRRHLRALDAAMAQFGEDFDLDAFEAAFRSEDPDELNRVKAVERGVDQLYNYMAELAAFGLELAGERKPEDETNARRDLDSLARLRVLSRERVERLQRPRELRRLLVHEYATSTAAQVHEAAQILVRELPPFNRAYADWIKAGSRRPFASTGHAPVVRARRLNSNIPISSESITPSAASTSVGPSPACHRHEIETFLACAPSASRR